MACFSSLSVLVDVRMFEMASQIKQGGIYMLFTQAEQKYQHDQNGKMATVTLKMVNDQQ